MCCVARLLLLITDNVQHLWIHLSLKSYYHFHVDKYHLTDIIFTMFSSSVINGRLEHLCLGCYRNQNTMAMTDKRWKERENISAEKKVFITDADIRTSKDQSRGDVQLISYTALSFRRIVAVKIGIGWKMARHTHHSHDYQPDAVKNFLPTKTLFWVHAKRIVISARRI